MLESPLPTFRKEVLNYLQSCEHLLAVPVAPYYPPFTQDELQMVDYYAKEVAQMLAQLAKV